MSRSPRGLGHVALAALAAISLNCTGASREAPDVDDVGELSAVELSAHRGGDWQSLQNAVCTVRTINHLGLLRYTRTDPDLLQEILATDMFLADLPEVQALFADEFVRPTSLVPMYLQIARAVVNKQQPLADFLCAALDRGLIPRVGYSKVIERTVHRTYLLEMITREMASSSDFMNAVYEHLLAKREAFGIPSDFMGSVLTFYRLNGDAFEPIKIKSMDWVFSEYVKIRARGEILPQEIVARQKGLSFNILEASIADNLNGKTDNAMAGIGLAVTPTETLRVVGDNAFIEYILTEEWNSLYESWNFAFIFGNLPHFSVLAPKLLIPSVIGAQPNDYMFNRALALWTTINFYSFAQLTQQPDVEIPNQQELAELWGEINRGYAEALVRERSGAELDSFAPMLGMTYAMLWEQLKPLLIASGVITPEEAEQLSELLAGGEQTADANGE